jgi:hypothetical protein
MRKALLAVALALPLAGCFQSVDVPYHDASQSPSVDTGHQPGLDAHSGGDIGEAPGPDVGGEPGRDASYGHDIGTPPWPDATVTGCKLDQDCPPPNQTDPICNPLKAKCDLATGICGSERIPRVWDTDPGACNVAAECDCQSLSHDKCTGAYLCTLNKCDWKCGGCQADMECATGQICQEVSCAQPKQCIDGCRDSTGCTNGKICGDFVSPFCGDAYGQCIAGSTCQSDKDCPIGTACDFTGVGSPTRACIPGCHTKDNCPTGDQCLIGVCPECADCPCVGRCQSSAGCKVDADCQNPGEVCGSDPSCTLVCRVGCHDDTQCRADQQCFMPKCNSCVCDTGTCVPRPVSCQLDTDCLFGEVCAFDDVMKCAGTKHCVSGCFTADQCPQGDDCSLAYCGPCCPGVCTPKVTGCQTDADCKIVGEVCAFDDTLGCAGTKSCKPGCWAGMLNSICPVGSFCEATNCGPCCPGQCSQVKACQTEQDCPIGYACDFTGHGADLGCIPGCHSKDNCPAGDTCLMGPCPKCANCPCVGVCQGGCPGGEKTCGNTIDCAAWNSAFCATGCCQMCPIYDMPPCIDCFYPGAVGEDGCGQGGVCAPCVSCDPSAKQVCGLNYDTYNCDAAAKAAGTEVLHTGACLPYEGLGCETGVTCPTGEYCRNECPNCGALHERCTALDVCVNDWDCPGPNPPPTCAGAKWYCETASHTCNFTCP